METQRKFESQFQKSSSKSAEEIKAACERIMSYDQQDYDIRSNGNHIWVEVGEKKQQYWSPVLHLKIEKTETNHTFIKGQFAESPLLWIVFLAAKFVSIGLFVVALGFAFYKYISGWNFNTELFLMFGMISVWFTMFLISENYKRKGAGQIKKLYDFVDAIAA